MLEAVRASMKDALNGISYAAKAAANSLESTTEEIASAVPTTVPSTGTIQITTHQRPTSSDVLSNHVNSFSPLVPKSAVHLAAYVILQNHVQSRDPLASFDVFNAAKALMQPGLKMPPSQTSSHRSQHRENHHNDGPAHGEVVVISDDSDPELEVKPKITPRKTIARCRAVGCSNQASGLPTNAGSASCGATNGSSIKSPQSTGAGEVDELAKSPSLSSDIAALSSQLYRSPHLSVDSASNESERPQWNTQQSPAQIPSRRSEETARPRPQPNHQPRTEQYRCNCCPRHGPMDLWAVKQHLEAVHKADLDKGALPFCKDYLCRRKPRTTTTTGFIRHNLLTSAHKDASPGHTFIFVIQAPGVQISSESSSSSEAPLMGLAGPSSAPSSQKSLPSTPSPSSKRKGKHPSGASSASKKPKKGTDKKDKGKNKADQ